MNNEESNEKKPVGNQNIIKRKEDDVKLIEQLKYSPELFIPEKGSDAELEKLSLKVKLISGREFILSDYIADEMTKYHSKFFKDWYYKIADLVGDKRSAMDVYVKPEYVRLFTIQFVYARFPYLLLRTLRSRNRKSRVKGKLYHHLKSNVSDKLDEIIADVYDLMCKSHNMADFRERYGNKYKMYFEVELF